jgi:hypothetical protein
MGPGPGERGGQIVFDGTPHEARSANTLTGAYLGARKTVGLGFRKLVEPGTPRLILEGARDHNLQGVSVELPLQRLVCVTGRQRFGQEHPGAGRVVPGAGPSPRQGHRRTGRLRPPAGCRAAQRRRVRRPEPDRQDGAQQPGQLRRRLRRAAQDLRGRTDGPRTELHRRHLQLQRRRRPLPDLRRQRLRARGDAVPQRRLPALPRLRRARATARRSWT